MLRKLPEMWWTYCNIMFILCFYQAVGVIKAAKSNQSQTKIAMFDLRLLFESGKVRKDYERVKEKIKNEKADRIAEWKDRTENSKQQIWNPTVEAIQLQHREFEQMANESSMKIVKNTTSMATQGDLVAAEWKRKTGSFEIVCSKHNSCRKRCHNNNRSINNKKYNCYCDDQCYFVYQDCCYDYERYCGKQHTEKNKMQVLNQNMVSCIPGYEARDKNIWMVTKCSRGWPNNEVLYKCENASAKRGTFEVENIYEFLPVVDISNTVYHNAFCAQCNNLDHENFTYFSLNITCSILPPSSLSSLQDILSFVSEYCVDSKIFSMPAEDQARRYCNDLVVENCRTLGTTDSKKCRKGPVAVVTANQVNYKNIWCANCNEISVDTSKCGLEVARSFRSFTFGHQLVPSFSLIMGDTSGDTEKWRAISVSQKCLATEIFDWQLQICRRGKRMPPVKDSIDKHYVVIWLQNLFALKQSVETNATAVRSAIAQKFHLNETQISHVVIRKMPHYYIVEFEVYLTKIDTLSISIFERKLNKEVPNEMSSIADLLHFTDEFIIQISLANFKVFKATSRRLACIEKQTFTKNEYIVTTNKKYHIIATNQTFSSNEVYHEGTNVTVCDDFVLSACEGIQIYLTPEEYTKFPNLSVYYKRTQTLYNIGDYRTRNNTIILCTNTSHFRGRTGANSDNMVLEILTISTFILSLMGLASLIFTYALFPELRKLPGKNLLNLAVSLFLAQLLWLLAVEETKRPQFCTVIAIIEHYLFLVTFTAMSVIAFHTKKTFALKTLKRPTQNEDTRQFLIYSAFVWGVPMLFISITTFLHSFDIYDAGYSSEHERTACWITKTEAQEFLFFLPVGLLVFFNTSMFIYTIIMIELNKKKSQKLHASRQKRREQNTVCIYLKLSSLTGLTWVFGFLHILLGSEIFSFLFVLLASLQGLFIALSFLINNRVVKLYHGLVTHLAQKAK